jgi:hypothetical protein
MSDSSSEPYWRLLSSSAGSFSPVHPNVPVAVLWLAINRDFLFGLPMLLSVDGQLMLAAGYVCQQHSMDVYLIASEWDYRRACQA